MMRIGIIGRSEWTYETMIAASAVGHEITFVVTAKEAPEYRYTSDDFKDFANSKNIPFLHTPKIDAIELKKLMSGTQVNICLSVNYSGIIKQEVIDLFPLGILNAHGGDLPRYRGNACQAWALINGEEKVGLCIHKMIGGELDSGPIIERDYYYVDINTRIGELYQWMDAQVPKMMLQAVEKLSDDPSYCLEEQSKDAIDALRCYPRKPEDGRIDWSKPANDIVRLINASSEPYPGAFALLNDQRVVIWRVELFKDQEVWCGVPGQVASIDKNNGSVIILCGKGKVKLTEVEIHGERTIPANWIRSIRTRLK